MKKQKTYKTKEKKTGKLENMKRSKKLGKRVSTTSPVEEMAPSPIAPKFTHDQLLEALYYAWDFMERALINFYLVGNTAASVLTKHLLDGDKIMIAVRKNEWESGARRIADVFAMPDSETQTPHGMVLTYIHNGLPIYLHVLEDNVVLQQADTVMYQAESFRIPSPYPTFLKLYPWLIR